MRLNFTREAEIVTLTRNNCQLPSLFTNFKIRHKPKTDQSFPSNPTGSLDAENLGKRMVKADRSCTAHRTEIHETFTRTVRINKGNLFLICRKKI